MHYIFLVILFIITFSCKAQSPIIDLDGWDGESVENAYYKDVNNFMDPFEGTWLYTNGNTSFKIVLIKTTIQYTGKFYTDYLTGEYQYIENGVEIANTLSNTNDQNIGIYGNSLLKNIHKPPCSGCPASERRVEVIIRDFISGLGGTLTLKLVTNTIDGQPAIEGFIYGNAPTTIVEGNPPTYTKMVIPTGDFTFIQQ